MSNTVVCQSYIRKKNNCVKMLTFFTDHARMYKNKFLQGYRGNERRNFTVLKNLHNSAPIIKLIYIDISYRHLK